MKKILYLAVALALSGCGRYEFSVGERTDPASEKVTKSYDVIYRLDTITGKIERCVWDLRAECSEGMK